MPDLPRARSRRSASHRPPPPSRSGRRKEPQASSRPWAPRVAAGRVPSTRPSRCSPGVERRPLPPSAQHSRGRGRPSGGAGRGHALSLPGGRGGGPSRVEPSGHTGGGAAWLGFRLRSGRLGRGRRENARCGRLDGVTGTMKTVRIFIRPFVRPNKCEHLSG